MSLSLEAKHDICTYLVLNLVNKRYWDDLCRENEILAYVVANLIYEKVEFVPWLHYVKSKYRNVPCRENEILAYMVTSLINIKVEFVPRCPLKWIMVFVPMWVLRSVSKRYWDGSCRDNEILAYMVANLINEKVEFVPWFKNDLWSYLVCIR